MALLWGACCYLRSYWQDESLPSATRIMSGKDRGGWNNWLAVVLAGAGGCFPVRAEVVASLWLPSWRILLATTRPRALRVEQMS